MTNIPLKRKHRPRPGKPQLKALPFGFDKNPQESTLKKSQESKNKNIKPKGTNNVVSNDQNVGSQKMKSAKHSNNYTSVNSGKNKINMNYKGVKHLTKATSVSVKYTPTKLKLNTTVSYSPTVKQVTTNNISSPAQPKRMRPRPNRNHLFGFPSGRELSENEKKNDEKMSNNSIGEKRRKRDLDKQAQNTTQDTNGNYSVGGDSNKTINWNEYKNKIKTAIDTFVITVQGLSMVQFAYLTISAYLFMVSFLLAVLCCRGKCTYRALKFSSTCDLKAPKKHESKGFQIQLLILLFIFFFLYVGMEITYGGLLLTFVVDELGWSKAQGSLITSVFYGSFAAARGLGIFLAKCLSPTMILILDLVLTTLGMAAMLICMQFNTSMIWYLNVVLGVGMASIFPTGVTWAEQYLDLTGKATASFVVGSALGEMLLPAFTGFMFEQKGPMWLLYILTGCALFSIVIYIIMQNLAFNSKNNYNSMARGVTLTDLDHSILEMENIPLTPDLHSDQEPLISSEHEQNGSVVKSRKKVTFNLNKEEDVRQCNSEDQTRSILKNAVKDK